jgi:hypothetical protein
VPSGEVNMFKHYIFKFINWYIQTFESENFVHVSMIQAEMDKRIRNAEERLNKIRDKQECDKMNALRLDFKITEDGYLAEMESMEREMDNVQRMRDANEKLYFLNLARSKALATLAAKNRKIGEKITIDVGSSLGELDKLEIETNDVEKEISNNSGKDRQALRIEEK